MTDRKISDIINRLYHSNQIEGYKTFVEYKDGKFIITLELIKESVRE